MISRKREIPEGGEEIKKILWLLFWKEESEGPGNVPDRERGGKD